jgi:hypothetical protein
MNVVLDTRPSEQLADVEIVMELFRAVRDLQLRTAAQLVTECTRMFPDLPPERRQVCFGKLATLLEKDQ